LNYGNHDIQAEKEKKEKNARLYQAFKNRKRKKGVKEKKGQEKSKAYGLTYNAA